MRRPLFINRARWTAVATALTFGVSLFAAAGAAQAVVVNTQGSSYGVALVPGTNLPAGMSPVTSSGLCIDPGLSPDLLFQPAPASPLCWHGGAVMHSNAVFDLSWDPQRRGWSSARHYVEQFLRDVADGSGSLSNPYAVTGQYTDGSGRAAYNSVYGGGCVDFGSAGGSCQFGDAAATAPGHDYPLGDPLGCSPSGNNVWQATPNGPLGTGPNDYCVTDAQIRVELGTMITQTGVLGKTKPGYTPLIVLMTPPGVVTCVDGNGTLCSANSGSAGQFCSYHSQLNVGGTSVAYVVQPWVAHQTRGSICDDSDAPQIPNPVPVNELATDVGARLVSPISQGTLAAIVNPGLDGWYALNGREIYDNGCTPIGNSNGLDIESVNGTKYVLQREFNNAGAIETDPNALPCTPDVNLAPAFVVPSAVNQGDVVAFDGSKTVSSLIVPKANFVWTFGDGSTALGPSVVHAYAAGGTYAVKLSVTDRGGNQATLIQPAQVLDANGNPVTKTPAPTPTPTPSPGSGGGSQAKPGLSVRIQLMPQSLRSVLSSGLTVRVSSTQAADGIASVFIPTSAAKRAHIKAGNGPSVRIGLGTVTIRNGTGNLHVHLSKATAAKLRKLGHVTLTLRLALVATGNQHRAFVAAGRY